MIDGSLAGMSDAERRALVERLSTVDKDPGWTLHNAREWEPSDSRAPADDGPIGSDSANPTSTPPS